MLFFLCLWIWREKKNIKSNWANECAVKFYRLLSHWHFIQSIDFDMCFHYSVCHYMLNVALAFHFVSFWEWSKKKRTQNFNRIFKSRNRIKTIAANIRLSNCRNVDVSFPWILFLALAYLISARCQHTNAFISAKFVYFYFSFSL